MIKNDVSNMTRPYNVGIGLRNDTTIASIILYSKGVQTVNVDDSEKNFLKDLDEKVTQPTVQAPFEGSDRSISVLELDGKNKYYGIFNNIILTDVQESHSTIQKLHLNFSDSWNVFFFSDNPVMVNLGGGFLDNEAYPYYQEFMTAYENYLSGAQATRNNMSMILSYDGKIMDGYLTGVSVQTNAKVEGYKGFQMQFLVKKITWMRHNHIRDERTGEIIGTTQGDNTFNTLSNVGRLNAEYGGIQDVNTTIPGVAMNTNTANDAPLT